MDDRRFGRDHQLRLAVRARLLDRVPDQVEGRGGLRDGGEDRRLGQGELLQVGDAPVAARRRGHPVAVVPVEVVVQVGRDDLLLALHARVGLGEADRLDDLPDLALVGGREGRRRQEPVAHELLGDRRRAAGVAAQRVEPGGDDAGRIEARVVPERLVLHGRGGVDDRRRELGERDHVTPLAGEGGQLDLAGPIEDARLLVELDVAQDVLRSGEPLAVVAERGDRPDEPDDARHEEGGEEEDGERDRDPCDVRITGGATAGAVPAATLPSGKAGLHGASHDSIGGMSSRSAVRPASTCPRRLA